MKFSVLMSVYKGDKSHFLEEALRSIWDDQEVKPNEIILIEDGPIPKDLSTVVNKWQKKIPTKIKIIKLKKNQGNGAAKRYGILQCKNELIAIMDADDISKPSRFRQQLKVFQDRTIDVCGSWVEEFYVGKNDQNLIHKKPEQHSDIYLYSKYRNPINHPSVMFRKEKVIEAGNYMDLPGCEDQYLWVRLIIAKATFYNIQAPLVLMRITNDLIKKRRSGWSQNIKEYNAQKIFYRIGFLSFYELCRNVVMGSIIRMLPNFIFVLIYRFIRKYF